jgi:hypothetical protein
MNNLASIKSSDNESQPQPQPPSTSTSSSSSSIRRARWDKTKQEMDSLLYFNFPKVIKDVSLDGLQLKNDNDPLENEDYFGIFKMNKIVNAMTNTSSSDNKINNNKLSAKIILSNEYKRKLSFDNNNSQIEPQLVNNTNLTTAKQQLIEMKKTIDKTVPVQSTSATLRSPTESLSISSSATSSTSSLMDDPKSLIILPTSNHKTMKRTTEKSLTTTIIPNKNNKYPFRKNSFSSTSTATTTTTTSASFKSNKSSSFRNGGTINENRTINKNSSDSKQILNRLENKDRNQSLSLHNLKAQQQKQQQQQQQQQTKMNTTPIRRLNSMTSTSSSTRSVKAAATSTATTFNYNNQLIMNEYKENKAYELRKRSALVNKYNKQQSEIKRFHYNTTTTATPTTNRRLFMKKNEFNNDIYNFLLNGEDTKTATNSFYSIISDGNKDNSDTPITWINEGRTMSIRNKIEGGKGASSNLRHHHHCHFNQHHLNNNNRTNSEKDLLEILTLNNETPCSDLEHYKIMLTECERLDEHINKLKAKKMNIASKLPAINSNLYSKLKSLHVNNEKLKLIKDSSQTKAKNKPLINVKITINKRSSSLPSSS